MSPCRKSYTSRKFRLVVLALHANAPGNDIAGFYRLSREEEENSGKHGVFWSFCALLTARDFAVPFGVKVLALLVLMRLWAIGLEQLIFTKKMSLGLITFGFLKIASGVFLRAKPQKKLWKSWIAPR